MVEGTLNAALTPLTDSRFIPALSTLLLDQPIPLSRSHVPQVYLRPPRMR